MRLQSTLLFLVLVLPAALLLLFGPRGSVDAPHDRLVLRYWEKWSGVEQQAITAIVQEFNDTVGAERGVWVEYNPISDIEKRMLIATAGGDPPDIAGLYDFILPQYADQDALLALDELIADAGVDLQSLNPIWLDICRYRGDLYALPSTPYTIALYYNRRLFREAGLDPNNPPRTTDEFYDAVIRLTRTDDAGRISQLGWTTSPAMLGWWPWIWPKFFDAPLWDGERFVLDAPEPRAAYDWLLRMRRELGPQAAGAFEASAAAIEGAQNPFLSERLAMVFQGPWMSKWLSTYAPQVDYGVAPFPSRTLERRNNFASADVYVIPRGARRPREAMIFLAYMMRQDVMEKLCKAHGKVSPFRTPGEDFARDHPNPHIDAFNELATSAHAFGYPQMPTWTQAMDNMRDLLVDLLRDDPRFDDALRRTQRQIQSGVEEYAAMSARRRAAAGEDGREARQ